MGIRCACEPSKKNIFISTGGRPMVTIQIDKKLCNSCELCLKACRAHVFKMNGDPVPNVEPFGCISCGHCVAACPTAAILHSAFRIEDFPAIDTSRLPDRTSLMNLFRKRRSIRSFKDQSIPRETIENLLAISAYAPSAHNMQPVDWLVIDSKSQIRELSKRATAILGHTARIILNPIFRFFFGLTEGFQKAAEGKKFAKEMLELEAIQEAGEDPIFGNASVVAIAHTPSGSYFSRDDAIYALYNVELLAERVGLATCQMGYFKLALDRSASLRQAMQLPEGRSPEAAIVIGYPSVVYNRMIPKRKPDILWRNSP